MKQEKGTDYFSATSFEDIFSTDEKPFAGFSMRQVISSAIALFIALGMGYVLVGIFNFKMSNAAYPIMCVCVPILVQAWVKPDDLDPFVWLGLWIEALTTPRGLVYSSAYPRLSSTYPDIRRELINANKEIKHADK